MSKEPKSKAIKQTQKIFVLDTSVILYDHNAFENFQEHDVTIPIQVLEELDNMKTGNDTRNFEARGFIRLMDSYSQNHLLTGWLPLNGKQKGSFKVIVDKPTAQAKSTIVYSTPRLTYRKKTRIRKWFWYLKTSAFGLKRRH
jgi:PhoH-like ATPase